ncbi:MAG TPA: TolC family protein, partial [Longimicrobium sp.]|nr:TolC family protein [Longimicrobium sp.]
MKDPDRPRPVLARLLACAVPLALAAAAPLAAQDADPLGGYVRQALEGNLGLRQERLSADRAEAAVREARGLYLPNLTFDSRYSEMRGGVNIGDFINPAYGALNEITG